MRCIPWQLVRRAQIPEPQRFCVVDMVTTTLSSVLQSQRIDDRHQQGYPIALPAKAIQQRLIETGVMYEQYTTC